ncbi:MAG: hypothetical protein WD824_10285 [Cyclobacteriaceae bacterium]
MFCRLTISALLSMTTITCSDNNDIFKHENFVGRWVITYVDQDGNIMSEWNGVHLTFEQTTSNSGHYSMTDTKYDSIWSQSGAWRKSDRKSELLLDDTLSVSFHADDATLIIQKYLPWTGQPACNDGICTPIVTGNWEFRFERDNK